MKFVLPGLLILFTTTSFTSPVPAKLKRAAESAKAFAKKKGLEENIAFLVDFSISSGSYRFFVVDLRKDSVIDQGLVAHGHCHTLSLTPKFSNVPGCACSSLGRYRVGKSYQGNFGLAYKLAGLDSTNSKAEERYIVLHAHSCVPGKEVHPNPICQSQGCPTVAPEFLTRLQKIISASKKPVLLWLYQ